MNGVDSTRGRWIIRLAAAEVACVVVAMIALAARSRTAAMVAFIAAVFLWLATFILIVAAVRAGADRRCKC